MEEPKKPELPAPKPFVSLPPVVTATPPPTLLHPSIDISVPVLKTEHKDSIVPPLLSHPKTDGHGFHIAPPLLEAKPDAIPHAEKLRPPQVLAEGRREEQSTIVVSKSAEAPESAAPA